jgi:arylsulfatase A-like enzyme
LNQKVLAAVAILLLSASGSLAQTSPAPEGVAMDRTVLPIPQPTYPPISTFDARNATPPPRFEVKAPAGAPNVLIILLDDMGFGQSSTFGGPVNMPTLDALARQGLRYNEFHTTAICSPTRAALLTGRNHHMNNMGAITEIATAFPGNTGVRPNSIAPIAEILRLNGYSTAAFGKWHETPPWQVSPSGPTDLWPTRSGFDKFYGFMAGETNQYTPTLYEDMSWIEIPRNPHYHLMTDMTNKAIGWVEYQKSLTPDKPFFIYFAPGAVHAPFHVSKEWIDKYRGKFDGGWDKLREETLARQKQLGVVPPDTKLAPKPQAIKDWESLSPDEKRLFARQMEVFAGFGEYTDHEIGRLIDAIRNIGQLDNTLVFYIVGDNGASAEGGMNGLVNEFTYFNAVPETVADMLKHIDELGGPLTYPHYAAGWAVAGDTPFTWTKQIAGSYGGTRNPLVVFWPKRFDAKGQLRTQWHHVIDIAPTILEAAVLPEPRVVDGTPQTPIQGVSMVYSFDDPAAASRHHTQYFEILGNRGIYHDGWLAGTVHRAPWEYVPRASLEDDKWELYDTRNDFSLTNDLAATNPAKLKETQDLFLEEAVTNHVLPIDDRTVERFNPALAGRPDLMAGRTSLTVHEGMVGMAENVFINVKNRSLSITADVTIPDGGAEGTIIAQGGRFGGWSLYLKDHKPVYTYNFLGLQRFTIAGAEPVPAGRAAVRYDFAYDGGKPGAGGTGTLFVNGTQVAQGRIERTQCCVFGEEGADVGLKEGTPVSEDYQVPFKFTGRIERVTIEVKNPSPTEQQADDKADAAAKLEKDLSD